MADLPQLLKNRLHEAIKSMGTLRPEQIIHVQTLVSRGINNIVDEYGDPFKELTTSLGPTFDKIIKHEKALEILLDEYHERATKSGKMVRKQGVYPSVKVGTNHRIVIRELPVGTTLRREIYQSKRPQPCPDCNGTGVKGHIPGKTKKCPTCKGSGKHHPIKGVMLEVL